MKAREFIDKHVWSIVIIFSIITSLLTLTLIIFDASRNIDNQISSLYEKEQFITQDFSKVYELSNVTCNMNKENNIVIFREVDCSLTVKYTKTGEILTKELDDHRIGKSLGSSIAVVLGIGFISLIVSAFSLSGLYVTLGIIESKRSIKNRRKNLDDMIV